MSDAPILGTSGNDVLALAVDTSLSFTWVPDPGNTSSEYESVRRPHSSHSRASTDVGSIPPASLSRYSFRHDALAICDY